MIRTLLITLAIATIIACQAMAHSPSPTTPHAHPKPKTDSRAALAAARQQNAANIGGNFTLTNQDGKTVTQDTLLGKYTLLFFGFTRCGDECPTALSLLTEVYEQLPAAKQKQLQVVMVSVDGEHDTPAVLKDYVGNFNPTFQGWSGTTAQIDTITQQYVAYYALKKDETAPATYQVAHSAFIYLMNPQGKYIGHFAHKESAETLFSALDTTIQ